MRKRSSNITEDKLSKQKSELKGHFQMDWGRQGAVIFAYIVVLLGYFGIIANLLLVRYGGISIPYTEMDPSILFWTYQVYPQTFYLSILLLFFICFLLTYREDIPHYGIKASIWLVPLLIAEGFLFYWIMFGFSVEPFILQFANGKGYLNILILYGCTFTGALSGMKLKQLIKKKKNFEQKIIIIKKVG